MHNTVVLISHVQIHKTRQKYFPKDFRIRFVSVGQKTVLSRALTNEYFYRKFHEKEIKIIRQLRTIVYNAIQ